jgi:ABC-2 type transport system ATP-binding protein
MWTQVRRLADDGAAVLLVTHNVLEAERCVDRLAIVADGRVVAQGAPATLKAKLAAPLRLECVIEPGLPVPTLPPDVTAAVQTGRRLVGQVQLADVAAAVAWAQHAQDTGAVAEFAITPASLEDVYASWVTTEGQPA